MNYTQVTFRLPDAPEYILELIPAYLSEIGFDSFEETSQGIMAYCSSDSFNQQLMLDTINEIPNICDIHYTYRITNIGDRNWNELWEQNSFEPIEVDERCVVRPSDKPTQKQYMYDIIINPVQSFGSGYHETTRMIMRMLLDNEITGKNVLDMGCGTAVLSILAAKRGASFITAIDIDPWSQKNAMENAATNAITNISIMLGDAELLKNFSNKFNIIMANINRNILLADMAKYYSTLTVGGQLMMSGFYENDFISIDDEACALGLKLIEKNEDNEWIAVRYIKI